eukprot:bmy_08085T0
MLLGQLPSHNLCQAPEWTRPVLPQVPRYVLTVPVWLGEPLTLPLHGPMGPTDTLESNGLPNCFQSDTAWDSLEPTGYGWER